MRGERSSFTKQTVFEQSVPNETYSGILLMHLFVYWDCLILVAQVSRPLIQVHRGSSWQTSHADNSLSIGKITVDQTQSRNRWREGHDTGQD